MSNELATKNENLTMSERFTNKVIAEFGAKAGQAALTDSQKRLAQNYFIAIDEALELAEIKRLAKKNNDNNLPITWQNVDLTTVAQGVVSCARIGWDPLQKNHVAIIPFKNKHKNKYDINFMPEYRGLELKAVKHGLDVPDSVVVELVYSNDKFKPIKKDHRNAYDSYEFEMGDPFDRGTIRGGFYYHSYAGVPIKNKLVVMSLADIEKRKPEYASVDFWGGEKDVWENGKKVGKVATDGWRDKMCWKTIYRAAYNDITIDSQKIDDDYQRIKQSELAYQKAEVDTEIAEKGNTIMIDEFTSIDAEGEIITEPEVVEEQKTAENKQDMQPDF